MKIKNFVKDLNEIFLPVSDVGGLQVTNSLLRYVELENGDVIVKDVSLRLPPGIVEGGKVKDRANFATALKTLHKQIQPNINKIINVVLTIPTVDVYVESFSVPSLSGSSLEEAVDLNMKVLSPNPIEKSYYSWMMVGRDLKEGGQIEILGAFVLKSVIDEFVVCLEEAGFGVAAVEFSSLSLVRMLGYHKIIMKDAPNLLIKLSQDGIIFLIIRNGNLYFNYFYSWDALSNEEITLEVINEIIKRESVRVLSFYTNRWGGQIKNIILISPTFIEEISGFLRKLYPNFQITILPSDKENLHGVRGAALRGLTSRSMDNEINLMNPKSISAFWQDEIINFIKLWRNIILTTLFFLVFIFVVSGLFLGSRTSIATPPNTLSVEELAELNRLKGEAQEFNSEVAMIGEAMGSTRKISPIIDRINFSVSAGIILSRLSIGTDGSGNIDGVAQSQDLIINFKNQLTAMPELADVNLPFSSIITQSSGQITFSLTFKLKPKS